MRRRSKLPIVLAALLFLLAAVAEIATGRRPIPQDDVEEQHRQAAVVMLATF